MLSARHLSFPCGYHADQTARVYAGKGCAVLRKSRTAAGCEVPLPRRRTYRARGGQKAVGYVAKEWVDEFVADKETGEMTVVKRKVTKKQVPPDLNAAKLLFELTGEKQFDIASMSDEDLQNERQKLLDILEENNDKTN